MKANRYTGGAGFCAASRGRLAQLVRAPALQAGGLGFESLTAHHFQASPVQWVKAYHRHPNSTHQMFVTGFVTLLVLNVDIQRQAIVNDWIARAVPAKAWDSTVMSIPGRAAPSVSLRACSTRVATAGRTSDPTTSPCRVPNRHGQPVQPSTTALLSVPTGSPSDRYPVARPTASHQGRVDL